MRKEKISGHRRIQFLLVPFVAVSLWLTVGPSHAEDEATVSGFFVANGKTVELPYVYVWAEKEGFYDPSDPTLNILFVERPLEPRKLGEAIWDAAWIQIGITETAEFTDQRQVQVYAQSIKLSADATGNISGGDYPAIELKGLRSERISGRIWHAEEQQIFDNSFQYDLTFSAPISDPDAPIGEILPSGGGEPGKAYLAWVQAVHAVDVEGLKRIVPSEMAEQINSVSAEEARVNVESMQSLTPTDVTIVGGSSDGTTALLQIEGKIEGETISAEVTMSKIEGFWIPTEFSM